MEPRAAGRRGGTSVSRGARLRRRAGARPRAALRAGQSVVGTSPVERAFRLDLAWPVGDDGTEVAEAHRSDLADVSPRPAPPTPHLPARSPAPGTVEPDQTWDAQHPLAAHLFATAPDASLMAELEALDPADVDDAALVEGMAAWQRVASRTAARQAAWIAELERRRSGSSSSEGLSDEVAAALGCTGAAADRHLGLAVGLDRLPAVADSLARGDIDVRRADVLLEVLSGLPDAAAAQLATDLCAAAPALTGPQLRARARRAVLALDPDAADASRRRARKDRRVVLEPARDSMAWISAFLPADAATAVMTTLTSLADLAAPDDGRSIDERRADALVDLATRFLDAGTCPDGPLPTRQGRRPHLQVTASLTTLLGLDDDPATLAGYGPIPAAMAREIAARSSWQPLLVSDDGRVLAAGTYRAPRWLRDHAAARDVTCTFIGCRMPADRCDLDHVEPWTSSRPADEQTTDDNLRHLCRHHHRLKTSGRWQVHLDPATGDSLWTTPTGRTHRRPLLDPPGPASAPPGRDPTRTAGRDGPEGGVGGGAAGGTRDGEGGAAAGGAGPPDPPPAPPPPGDPPF